jgi:SAM-dependent methyltransferase
MNEAGDQIQVDVGLIAEQQDVQAGKERFRSIEEYDQSIFLGADTLREGEFTSEAEELIDEQIGRKTTSLKELLLGLQERNGRPVQWVDMGGGFGFAQRQIGTSSEHAGKIETTNVDIIDPASLNLSDGDKEYLERKYPGLLDKDKAPNYIQANVETVQLPEQPDLITAHESIQYLSHPLEAISHWYNSLADGGMLIVAAEHRWTGFVRFEDRRSDGSTPFEEVFRVLDEAEIQHAESSGPYRKGTINEDRRRGSSVVVMVKKPGTFLRVRTSVAEIQQNHSRYNIVYYKRKESVSEVVSAISEDATLEDLAA